MKPVLYILVRSGLASMNPGKAAAQAGHGVSQFRHEAIKFGSPNLDSMLRAWEDETSGGFGTCLVLSATYEQLKEVVVNARLQGLHAGIVNDPTYPLLDGDTLHLIPLDTCAYLFGMRDLVSPHVSHLNLMA